MLFVLFVPVRQTSPAQRQTYDRTNGPTSYYKPVGKASPDASASLQTVNMLHRILGRRVVGRHHFTRVGHSRDFPEDTPAKPRKTSKELL